MEYKQVYKTIINSIAASKKGFAWAIILTLLQKSMLSAIPIIFGNVIDLLPKYEKNSNEILILMVSYIALWIIIVILNPVQNVALASFTQKTVLQKTIEWFKEFFHKDLGFFFENNAARVSNIIERGIHAYEKLLNHFCNTILPTAIELLVVSALLIEYGGMYVFLGVIVLAFVQSKITLKAVASRRVLIDEINNIEDELAEESVNLLQKGFIFQIFNAVNFVLQRLKVNFSKYADVSVSLTKSGGLLSMIGPTFQNLSTVLGLIFGLFMYKINLITIGEIIILVGLLSRVSYLLSDSIGSFRIFDQFIADIQALNRLNLYPDIERKGMQVSEINKIKIQKGSFKYNETGSFLVISNDLEFLSGEKIAIIGPSGSGKSTLLGHLIGVFKVSRDAVKWDDNLVESISHHSQINLQSYSPQSPMIFTGTFAENLLIYQDPNQDLRQNKQLEKITSGLEIQHIVNRTEKSATISESNISGGEAKRISLTRSLIKNAKIRYFDEPTSGLNPEMANKVWDILLSKDSPEIIFCATHDLTKLDQFDRFIKVDNQVVSEITKSELLKLKSHLQE